MTTKLERVIATPLTLEWLQKLTAFHGPLLFYQSGGCCEGSAPLCLPQSDYKIGSNDVFLGLIGQTPFYMSSSQFEYWKHTQLVIDVVKGGGNAFSVESPEGISFHTRSNIFTDEEMRQLDEQGAPPDGKTTLGIKKLIQHGPASKLQCPASSFEEGPS